jgi:FixJ family two-component response regulator
MPEPITAVFERRFMVGSISFDLDHKNFIMAKALMTPIGRTIAIVDDDAAVCESTRFLLETYDFGVLTYQSAADFLDDDPDIGCLIVDYQMPGMNGPELLSELRKRGSKVPAIMITATITPPLQRRGSELGIRRFLEKPLSNRTLLDAIRESSHCR